MRSAALAVAFAVVGIAGASTIAAAPRPVGLRVVRLVDHSRVARFRDGSVRPRTLVTYVRYPRSGSGPFPLVVFVHGFALAPGTYVRLLDAWARAGYVVAAPLFPVEGAGAPGGPSESDLLNEPGDVAFVITKLLSGPVRTLIDRSRIAVAGHSDGGVAALAAAYATRLLDPRIDAAIVLSGAQPPGVRFDYATARPLLAVQGTADPINGPANTRAFFALAHRPKFLLSLIGASHLPPYTSDGRQLGVVERATIAFLDHYLRNAPLKPLLAAAPSGLARLAADP
jgi:pimeloyl-ACP methyl ester carboxylesterase